MQKVTAACLATILVGAANAQNFVVVKITNSTASPCNGNSYTRSYPVGTEPNPIVLDGIGNDDDFTSCAIRVNLYAQGSSPGVVDLPRIELRIGTSGQCDVVLGTGDLNQSDTVNEPTGKSWGGLETSALSDEQRLRIRLGGAIGGDITDSIHVGTMYRLDLRGTSSNCAGTCGQLRSQIHVMEEPVAPRVILECFGISGSGSFLLDCGDITRIRAASRINSGATIEARGQRPDLTECGGNIQLIQCDQGLRGAIVAPRGYIREITVNGTGSNGEILDQASPRTFPLIRARDGIRSISANSIDADISANSGGGNGVLGRLVTRSGNFTGNVAVQAIGKFDTAQSDAGVEIAGNLVGELCPRAGGITVPVRINGDVTSTGSIRVVGGPLVDDATRDGRLTIGGSMAGSISIEQAAGLQGQVVINANAGTGTWTGSVRIGPLGSQTTLTPAYYSNLSATLGGGAVGLVPFQQHDADCSPPQLTALPPPQLDPGDGRTVLSSALAHETPCVPGAYDPVSFTLVRYGPIFSPAGNAPAGPFEVFPANESTGAPIPGGHSLAGSFVFTDYNTSPGPPYKRSVTMHSGSPLPAGLYVVVAERQDGVGGPTPESAIVGPRCDALLTTSTVLADDFRYHFRVLSDCNRNGVADRDDIAADPGLDFFPVFGGTTCGISFLYGNCVIDTCEDQCQYVDLNNDGNLDQGDLDCFVAGVAGDLSCAPGWPQGALDLNNDGNVDQADIELMTSWVAGDCAVDPCE